MIFNERRGSRCALEVCSGVAVGWDASPGLPGLSFASVGCKLATVCCESVQRNWRLCGDPGTAQKVVTANGEVQTSEEAQVFVHDLELFVTVQILEDTPAVLSLCKVCEEHGYTYAWASGQSQN